VTLLQTSDRVTSPDGPGTRRVTLLSGFLGSGKSTLLRSHLRRSAPYVPEVIVNDFAATQVDGVMPSQPERVETTLTGGCVCCTRREELAAALRDLLDTDADGAARPRDVVIETSGLSDPGPIAFTLANDPVLKHHFILAEVCVTVDALTSLDSLSRHPVAARQLLAADRLFVTKADLVQDEDVDSLVRHLQTLNPSAHFTVTAEGDPLEVIAPVSNCAAQAPTLDPAMPHTQGVSTLELRTERPLDWQAFSVWLSLLLHEHGPSVLRVKGVLDVEGVGPVALNGVQHIVHRPEHLASQASFGTRLVLILQGLEKAAVQRSFNVFLGLNRKGLSS
jgi:G3E family GTPase